MDCDCLHLIPICTGYFSYRNSAYHALSVNDCLVSMLGMPGDEIAAALSDKFPEFIDAEDAETVSLMLHKASVSGGSFREMARIRQKNGSYQWMEIRLSAELEPDGSCTLCLVLVDEEMRMERQKKLDGMFAQLLDVMNNTPGGIVVFDSVNGRTLVPSFVSQGMADLLRGTLPDIKKAYKENPYAGIHPEDREIVIRAVEEALRNLSAFRLNIRLRTIPGDYIWVSAHGTVDTAENQRNLYVAFSDTSADTEYMHIQKQILDNFSRRQYEHICFIDAMRNAFRILNATPGHDPFLSGPGDDFEGSFAAFVNSAVIPEERDELIKNAKLSSLLEKLEKSQDVELFCTQETEGGRRSYKKNWFSWIDKEAKTIALVNSDITDEFRRAEQSRDVLKASLRAAEQANSAKTDFLARMSHDIRTPLNAIIGYIEMSIEDSSLGEGVRAQLTKADTSSKFLLSLINDILNMSRIESGKLALKEESFSLTGFIGTIASIASSQCAVKNIHFISGVAPGAHNAFRGDQLKLQQILINIVGNAVKFTPENGKIELSVKEFPRGDSALVRFIVADTGCGISKNFLPHIFEPFTQDSRVLNNEIKGTGLGLAICKSLVSMMGGTISAKSEEGKGSRFIIEVPLGISDGDGVSLNGTSEDLFPAEHNFGGKRILLAEDNDLNVEIAKHVLEKVKLTVDVAGNGKQACDLFAASPEGHYSAILMDVRMPVMNGIEATERIRHMERGDRKIPVIAMSANAFDDDVRNALNVGMNAYTIKPIDVPQLYATIHRFIK